MNREGYFVSGSDTGVGKTIFSAYLTKCHSKAHYWKPVQCGRPTDQSAVGDLIGKERTCPSSYSFNHPLSPNQAASLDKREIDLASITMPVKEALVVEGAGGVWVPLNREESMMDLMAVLKLPVILVVRSSLGTLNHSLLSIEAIRRRNIPLHSLVMVGEDNEANRLSLEWYGKGVPIFVFPRFASVIELHHFDLPRVLIFFGGVIANARRVF